MLHQAAQPRVPKCAGCNSPSNCVVWEQPMCFDCQTAWYRCDDFSSGTINAALGISDRPEDFTEANHKRYCAEATRRTKAWLAQRAAVGRAA